MNTYPSKLFEDSYNNAGNLWKKFSGEANRRRIAAYILKSIAVFGGLAIATGYLDNYAQVIGVIITIVVAIDGIFSNHKRLLITSKAAQALKILLKKTRLSYNQELAPIVKKKDDGKTEEAAIEYDALNIKFSSDLNAHSLSVETAVDEADLKLLESLSVEEINKNHS